ncbi:hypothetical protein [Microcoleus vaginatus]|uniref:hypothetical protein n=1 Tax=Microcoleus vaginatus TaxID=119532 RepID=UPI001F618A40
MTNDFLSATLPLFAGWLPILPAAFCRDWLRESSWERSTEVCRGGALGNLSSEDLSSVRLIAAWFCQS